MWFPQLGLKAFPYGAFVGGTMHEGTLIPWRVSIVPHGPIWVWISLHRLLILPWKGSVIPHGHVCSRVSLY